jgi:hypothetical protein
MPPSIVTSPTVGGEFYPLRLLRTDQEVAPPIDVMRAEAPPVPP